jgi:hypothetical protein
MAERLTKSGPKVVSSGGPSGIPRRQHEDLPREFSVRDAKAPLADGRTDSRAPGRGRFRSRSSSSRRASSASWRRTSRRRVGSSEGARDRRRERMFSPVLEAPARRGRYRVRRGRVHGVRAVVRGPRRLPCVQGRR